MTITSSSGFWTGNNLKTTWSIMEKMAVFAPMPKASDISATPVKTGLFFSDRNAYFMSLASVSTVAPVSNLATRVPTQTMLGPNELQREFGRSGPLAGSGCSYSNTYDMAYHGSRKRESPWTSVDEIGVFLHEFCVVNGVALLGEFVVGDDEVLRAGTVKRAMSG